MQLAFILCASTFRSAVCSATSRIALECQRRGHTIRVYAMIWEGEVPDGFEVLIAPVKALFNHTRNERFTAWVEADLAKRPVDRVIGFNKMPGLDVLRRRPMFRGQGADAAQPDLSALGPLQALRRVRARSVRARGEDRNPDDLRSAAAAVRQTLRHARRMLSPVAAGHRSGSPRAGQCRADSRRVPRGVRSAARRAAAGADRFRLQDQGVDRSLKACLRCRAN